MKDEPKLVLDKEKLQQAAEHILNRGIMALMDMHNPPGERAQRVEAYTNALINIRRLIEE